MAELINKNLGNFFWKKANWNVSNLTLLGILSIYLSLLRIKADGFGLMTNIVDIFIVANSVAS